ncbi:MAG: DUF1343 domain-containing protein, partial [Leptospiraceae bacterium]|nr:DUF1343 domain-containing protein [Leptospiraceae bacterium]
MDKTIKRFFKRFENAYVGILTNQSAYGYNHQYHFQLYRQHLNVKVLFLPEHGLFAELQDQVSGSNLHYHYEGISISNLYGDTESSLYADETVLSGLDYVLIDIRDVGARYYTFLTTALYIMKAIHRHNRKRKGKAVEILIIDSPNPIGRKIEGSPLKVAYESFVGVEGVLHRHGLSPAELLSYYNYRFKLRLNLHILPVGTIYPKKMKVSDWISPSPNIPSRQTCYVYPGQCLLEGTNISEGRGTTRPFEIFGAPYINIENRNLLKRLAEHSHGTFQLRPLLFIPTFHKHANEICGGFQLMLEDKKRFHSLLFTLHFLRCIQEEYLSNFSYREGVYEFCSNRKAIEILVGDEYLLEYLDGKR